MHQYQTILARNVVRKPVSLSFQYAATPACNAYLTTSTAATTTGYNTQLHNYLDFCQTQQDILLQRTEQYLNRVYAENEAPSVSLLRDRNTWPYVKRLVVREELMKAQITGKVELPLMDFEKQEILDMIQGKDLADLDDAAIDALIDKVIQTDDQAYLDAIIQFKETGQASDLLQQSKLSELSKEVEHIDLNHITRDQYKHLLENYCERTEFHHRESISQDPAKQSNADNIDVLNTSEHDKKHTDPETGKTNYRDPVSEEPHSRAEDMIEGNRQRVLRNELRGLGLAAAIGFGTGFTISMLAEMAQHGISGEQFETVFFNALVSGTESGLVSGASYLAGRGVTYALESVGLNITGSLGSLINFGAVGMFSTTLICAYQYAKARANGFSSREAFSTAGKTAVSSLSLLSASIVAQGIWGGPAGILVSTGVGVVYLLTDLQRTVHSRKVELRIREFSIEEYIAILRERNLIYTT